MTSEEIVERHEGIGMASNNPEHEGQEVIRIAATIVSPPSGSSELTITEVCRKYSVTARALRFYESKSLLTPLRYGLARRYRPEDCHRLVLILKAKAFGFTLGEIARMFGVGNAELAPHAMELTRQKCRDQIQWLQSERARIDAAIIELQALLQL